MFAGSRKHFSDVQHCATLWGLNVCWQSGGALVCSSALDPGQSPGHGGRGHFDFTGGPGGFRSLA